MKQIRSVSLLLATFVFLAASSAMAQGFRKRDAGASASASASAAPTTTTSTTSTGTRTEGCPPGTTMCKNQKKCLPAAQFDKEVCDGEFQDSGTDASGGGEADDGSSETSADTAASPPKGGGALMWAAIILVIGWLTAGTILHVRAKRNVEEKLREMEKKYQTLDLRFRKFGSMHVRLRKRVDALAPPEDTSA